MARALAADPPVLLMDEPFGALDPISRERLQTEFAALHRRLGKTVVFVTHDIEEAVLLGRPHRADAGGTHRPRWGRRRSCGASPAQQFVRDFFGDEFGLRILSRHRVADLALGPPLRREGPRVHLDTNLRDVLAIMVTESVDVVAVAGPDDGGPAIGGLTFCEVVTQVRANT